MFTFLLFSIAAVNSKHPEINSKQYEKLSRTSPSSPMGAKPSGTMWLRGEGSILGLVPDGERLALQLRSQETTGGYSGGPVWDRASRRVIGMILRGVEADGIGRLSAT